MSSEQVTTLIDLHRKIATLEAELSHAHTNNRQLELTIQRLLQPLSTFSTSGRLQIADSSAYEKPGVNVNGYSCQQCLAHDADAEPVTPSPPRQPNVPAETTVPRHAKPSPALANDHETYSETDDYQQPGDNRKALNVTDNPHAPRFMPSGHSQGYRRTIIVTGLSQDVTLKALAWKVCGGLVVSMKLLDTTKLLGSNSALIQFFEENSALDFVQHCKRVPLMLGDKQIEVKTIDTPTAPVPAPTYYNIIDYYATRCITIDMCPAHLSMNHIRMKLSPHEHTDMSGILEMFEDGAGIIYIAFDSIDAASSARARLNTYSTFRPARAEFKSDPCAVPCSSLSAREAKSTMFTTFERPRQTFAPPRGPRAMRGRPPPFRGFRGYYDMDAPRSVASPRELDYELEAAQPPPTPMLRRAQPIDYSDLAAAVEPKVSPPNILEVS